MESTPKENSRTDTWIALLGRADFPADGVADYCQYLSQNLAKLGVDLRPVRVEWVTDGWLRSLRNLWIQSRNWRGMWVIPQYTAMAWSGRGFPIGALASVMILRARGARCAITFHEPWGASGSRAIDKIRCSFQNWTIRTLHRMADRSILTIPLNTALWLSKNDVKSASIPLGSNIPENLEKRAAAHASTGGKKTVVVFCVSEPPHGNREINDIAAAMRLAASKETTLRVVFVGRGTVEAQGAIDRAFEGSEIEVCNRGLRPPEEVSRIFSEADAMLAVRGRLYLRRGSALAGLACGLPIVGYAGAAEATILAEAGIMLVPFEDQAALGSALRDILTDSALWQKMHEKNLHIQQTYLSWSVIAASYAGFLGN